MSTSTSYMVCVVAVKDGGISHAVGAISLRNAAQVIEKLRSEMPSAHLIFLRRYKRGTDLFVVLHQYTVLDGSTADERRRKASV